MIHVFIKHKEWFPGRKTQSKTHVLYKLHFIEITDDEVKKENRGWREEEKQKQNEKNEAFSVLSG